MVLNARLREHESYWKSSFAISFLRLLDELVFKRETNNLLIVYGDADCNGQATHSYTRIVIQTGQEDSPRQDKIICSMQTLPRSSTHAQSHLGMPNRRKKFTKNGNGPSKGLLREILYNPDAPRIAEAVIKTLDGI
ncbi:hypothetical protein TNCV_4387921 [Trichonephila clavipes]|nr:hypothetical protein TNCV_4387921 [Trichonephila clavipes]